MKTFLLRSSSAPIDLVVITQGHNAEQIRGIIDIIIPHLSRCRSLTIRHDDDTLHATFFPLPGRLERLEMPELFARTYSRGPITLFTRNSAPPLRSLSIHPRRALPLSMDFVPANALTHLTSEIGQFGTEQAEFVQFLHQCTMMEGLQLAQRPCSDLLPDNFIPVSLPSLKSLY